MPLPWLIGAAVVGIGSAVIAALKSDDAPSPSSGSSSSSSDEERRIREAAAAKQRRMEREQKKTDARTLFAEQGDLLGESLADALDGVVDVMALGSPAFNAVLDADGYRLPPADTSRTHEVGHALAEANVLLPADLARITRDLAFYTSVYDVHLQGSLALYRQLMNIQTIDSDLAALKQLEARLLTLQGPLTAPHGIDNAHA